MSRSGQSKADVAAPNIRNPSSFHLFALPYTVLLKVTSHSKKAMGSSKKEGEERPISLSSNAHISAYSFATIT